ncbi:MAG: DUF2271 domain-containing protein, partial [Syntrophomonas sp.]|nr:DUF2271 domain-containing protein [Syntrophomonas sp.]
MAMQKWALICTLLFVLVFSAGCGDKTSLIPLDQTVTAINNNNVAQPGENQPGELEISLDFKGGTKIPEATGLASNQWAVWIEDDSGRMVKTVFVTNFTAKGGYMIRPESLPTWVAKAQPAALSGAQIDAISSATPRSGHKTYTWDCRDESGKVVPAGTYRFNVEGSYSWQNKVLFSGAFTVGGNTVNDIAVQAAYNSQETHNRNMITNVKAQYVANNPVSIPIGQVVLNYIIGQTDYRVNGRVATMDTAPVVQEGRTLMPIRYVTDNIGAAIQWNEAERTVTITQDNQNIKLKIGVNTAQINGESVF